MQRVYVQDGDLLPTHFAPDFSPESHGIHTHAPTKSSSLAIAANRSLSPASLASICESQTFPPPPPPATPSICSHDASEDVTQPPVQPSMIPTQPSITPDQPCKQLSSNVYSRWWTNVVGHSTLRCTAGEKISATAFDSRPGSLRQSASPCRIMPGLVDCMSETLLQIPSTLGQKMQCDQLSSVINTLL